MVELGNDSDLLIGLWLRHGWLGAGTVKGKAEGSDGDSGWGGDALAGARLNWTRWWTPRITNAGVRNQGGGGRDAGEGRPGGQRGSGLRYGAGRRGGDRSQYLHHLCPRAGRGRRSNGSGGGGGGIGGLHHRGGTGPRHGAGGPVLRSEERRVG